jgi:hypothetical protein
MSGETKPEGDMTREIRLPTTYGYLEPSPVPPCWYCRCVDCCCGWMNPHALSFKPRMMDCVATFVLWKYGAYPGAKFDRAGLENLSKSRVIPVDLEGKSGVYSMDTTIPSLCEPGYKIGVRIFKPKTTKATKRVLLYIHGGGL